MAQVNKEHDQTKKSMDCVMCMGCSVVNPVSLRNNPTITLNWSDVDQPYLEISSDERLGSRDTQTLVFCFGVWEKRWEIQKVNLKAKVFTIFFKGQVMAKNPMSPLFPSVSDVWSQVNLMCWGADLKMFLQILISSKENIISVETFLP